MKKKKIIIEIPESCYKILKSSKPEGWTTQQFIEKLIEFECWNLNFKAFKKFLEGKINFKG